MARHSTHVAHPRVPVGASVLLAWLVAREMSAADLAKILEVRPETLSRWMQGRLYPSKVARLAIEHVTGGVTHERLWAMPDRAHPKEGR